MQTRTTGLTIVAVISALAGALTIGLMAAQFTGIDSSNVLGVCCMYLVVAVLFFALAGGFKENGQWNIYMMEFMGFVIIAIVVFGAIVGIFHILAAVVLCLMAILVIAGILLSLRSENWFGVE